MQLWATIRFSRSIFKGTLCPTFEGTLYPSNLGFRLAKGISLAIIFTFLNQNNPQACFSQFLRDYLSPVKIVPPCTKALQTLVLLTLRKTVLIPQKAPNEESNNAKLIVSFNVAFNLKTPTIFSYVHGQSTEPKVICCLHSNHLHLKKNAQIL